MRRSSLAFALLITPVVATAQVSRDSLRVPATSAGPKSVAMARVLAIVPGVGHGYADEGKRGLLVVGGVLGISFVTGVLLAGSCVIDAVDGTDSGNCGDSPIADVGAAAVYALWGWSIYDAGSAARRTNARVAHMANRQFKLGLTRRPDASGRPARTLTVGLRFTAR